MRTSIHNPSVVVMRPSGDINFSLKYWYLISGRGERKEIKKHLPLLDFSNFQYLFVLNYDSGQIMGTMSIPSTALEKGYNFIEATGKFAPKHMLLSNELFARHLDGNFYVFNPPPPFLELFFFCSC